MSFIWMTASALSEKQTDIHMSALGGKFNGIVDQICDGLEQEITVAANHCLICTLDSQCDAFVFGDWLVEIADFSHQWAEQHLAKTFEPPAMLYFDNA